MLNSKTVRLVIVGGSASLLFFGLSYLFISVAGHPFASSVAAYGIAFVFAYTAQRNWTFGGQHDHGRAFPRYLGAQIFCALLSGIVSQTSSTIFSAPPSIASAAAMLAGSGASFLLVRFWVFSGIKT